MITITRRLEFDYGHRVLGHEGKCRNLHGHHGVAEVKVGCPRLDDVGRVVDFSVVKELVGGWINEHWDHNLLLNPQDPQLDHLCDTEAQLPYVMPDGNPTAENMAQVLFVTAASLLASHGVKVIAVTVWETPNCKATYKPR